MEYILEVQNIHTYIGQFHILEGVSLQVKRGSITVLLGRNGCLLYTSPSPRDS